MNIPELYDLLVLRRSLNVTLPKEEVASLKSRLTNYKSREGKKLGEFKDTESVLVYANLKTSEDLVKSGKIKLQINLEPRHRPIVGIELDDIDEAELDGL